MFILANLRTWSALLSRPLRLQRMCSNATKEYLSFDKDPQPLFTDPETQKLLQSITQMKLEKVFRKVTVPDNSSEIKFMTTEQLEEEFLKAVVRARKRLQMPPVIQVRQDKQCVISKDPALKNFSDTMYVFTDITYGLRQSERKVVIRQIDGTLEYAPQKVVKRMNQLYVPMPGRNIRVPRMFNEENLKRCLDDHKYEFILDRLTVQYEPYEADFHRFTSLVYQHVNESKQFDLLRSTRHFGPMTFFYAWHRCIDDLLYDMVQRDYLANGAELVALLYKVQGMPEEYKELLQHLDSKTFTTEELALKELQKSIKTPAQNIQTEIKDAIGKTAVDFEVDELCLKFIEHYIKTHALKKVQLELAVQTFKEINAEKKQLYEGLMKAHGVQSV